MWKVELAEEGSDKRRVESAVSYNSKLYRGAINIEEKVSIFMLRWGKK